MGRRTALEAAAAGLETTDIEMVVPLETAAGVLRLQEVVREAD